VAEKGAISIIKPAILPANASVSDPYLRRLVEDLETPAGTKYSIFGHSQWLALTLEPMGANRLDLTVSVPARREKSVSLNWQMARSDRYPGRTDPLLKPAGQCVP